ncbi:MAG: hypothetical protein PGN20_11525 [Agrobacterium cavarae]
MDESFKASDFQLRVRDWLEACFPASTLSDVEERTHRFVEEALELAQASGCNRSDAHALVDYVFGREEGDVVQETGGVMVTLAALCVAQGVAMSEAGEQELARNWSRIEQIRAKQASKPQGSALPQ